MKKSEKKPIETKPVTEIYRGKKRKKPLNGYGCMRGKIFLSDSKEDDIFNLK